MPAEEEQGRLCDGFLTLFPELPDLPGRPTVTLRVVLLLLCLVFREQALKREELHSGNLLFLSQGEL